MRRQRRIQCRGHEEHVAELRVGYDPELYACPVECVHHVVGPAQDGLAYRGGGRMPIGGKSR
jgi:hypothetical protein